MNFQNFSEELGSCLISLIFIAISGSVFENLDGESGSAGFMAGLCAACCILGMLGKLIGLAG